MFKQCPQDFLGAFNQESISPPGSHSYWNLNPKGLSKSERKCEKKFKNENAHLQNKSEKHNIFP